MKFLSKERNNSLHTEQNESFKDSDESIQKELELHEIISAKKQKEGTFGTIIKGLFKWSTIQLLLAHHPDCETFESHVFKIGKLRLCRGCTLSYPPAYALLLIFIFWQAAQDFFLSKALWIHNLLWFTIGFVMLIIITYFTRRFSKIINDLYKVIRGSLFGFLFIVVIGEVRTPNWYLSIIAGVIILGGLFYLSFRRGKEMEKTCNECEWEAQFHVCPGWKNLSDTFDLAPQPHPIDESGTQMNYKTNEAEDVNISVVEK